MEIDIALGASIVLVSLYFNWRHRVAGEGLCDIRSRMDFAESKSGILCEGSYKHGDRLWRAESEIAAIKARVATIEGDIEPEESRREKVKALASELDIRVSFPKTTTKA